ncbi:RHS repeat-associated core domain-containing protein [Flavobacterium sp. JP2137]
MWLNVDPLTEQTMEPYSYVGNNPINFTDPTGMSKEGKMIL